MPLVSLGKGTLANQAILKMKLPEKIYRLTDSIDSLYRLQAEHRNSKTTRTRPNKDNKFNVRES